MNLWMPVSITITNQGQDFDGYVGVNVFQSEANYDRYEMPFSIAGGATKTIQMPIKPLARQDIYAFELVSDQKIIAETRVKPVRLISPESVCVGVLSDDPAQLSYLAQRANGLNTLRGETWVTIPLNADTFPETKNLATCFSLLVVDGFDISSLSQSQQDTLTDWLQNGGIIFVSGGAKAALSYPFFEPWTGVSVSKIKEVDDITPALIRYISATGQPMDQKIWINPIPKEKALISSETDGLIALTKVGDGLIYLAAFDIGEKPFNSWSSAAAFWPRALRVSMPSVYTKMLEARDRLAYNDSASYRVTDLMRLMKVPNNESGLHIVVLIVLYVLMCGIGGFWLLRRIDKTEWMWAFTPAVTVVMAVVMFLLSNRSSINLPVALSTSQITVTDENTQIRTFVGVATPHRGELLVETDQNELPLVVRNDGYYFDRGAATITYRPINLNQRYLYGDHPAIGFASNEAWDPRTIEINENAQTECAVKGNLWIEEDGVHGEMTNMTDSILTDCAVITSFGYDLLGDILPGQRAEFVLVPPDKPIQFDAQNFQYEPGIMYALLDVTGPTTPYTRGVGGAMMYEFINAIATDAKGNSRGPKQEMHNTMIYLFEPGFSFYQSTSESYFFGFSDSLGQVSVKINGEPASRTAHQSVVGYKVPFQPIGPTGVVLYPQGYIPAEVIVDMGDGEKPRVPTQGDGTGNNDNQYFSKDPYIRYGSPVALRFVLPDHEQYTIEKLSIGALYYESVPNIYLYNHQTQKWDQQRTLTFSLTSKQCLPYIDEEGVLYVRYTPSENTGRYDSMQTPWIALKGKVK